MPKRPRQPNHTPSRANRPSRTDHRQPQGLPDRQTLLAAIGEGQADVVLLARQMLVEPNWPLHAAKVLGQKDKLPPPNQYARAW